jgi:hypothetical protein
MEATRSSETSVSTSFTRRRIPEYSILHSHRRENLNSYRMEHSLTQMQMHTSWTTVQSSADSFRSKLKSYFSIYSASVPDIQRLCNEADTEYKTLLQNETLLARISRCLK